MVSQKKNAKTIFGTAARNLVSVAILSLLFRLRGTSWPDTSPFDQWYRWYW